MNWGKQLLCSWIRIILFTSFLCTTFSVAHMHTGDYAPDSIINSLINTTQEKNINSKHKQTQPTIQFRFILLKLIFSVTQIILSNGHAVTLNNCFKRTLKINYLFIFNVLLKQWCILHHSSVEYDSGFMQDKKAK